jgi:hypothetical protein
MFCRTALALLLAATTHAATIDLTSNEDSGPGTLRQGILDANSGACASPCTITTQDHRIVEPLSPLPVITATGFTLDAGYYAVGTHRLELRGDKAGSRSGLRIAGARDVTLRGVTISAFPGHGIFVDHSSDVHLEGVSLNGNALHGLAISGCQRMFVIGNQMMGNQGDGIYVQSSTDLEINSNFVGADVDWHPAGNGGDGIALHDVTRAALGFDRAANNGGIGIVVDGNSSEYSLGYDETKDNGGLGIDVGRDGVTTDGLPELDSVTYNAGWIHATGHLHALPHTAYGILLYVNDAPDPSGYGEGLDALTLGGPVQDMTVRTDANGDATFGYFAPEDSITKLAGRYLTVQATRESGRYGQSSELGKTVPIVPVTLRYTVTNTSDSGPGSLRQAIEDANNGPCRLENICTIDFAIAGDPQNGVFTIRPESQLPAIRASGLDLDGATQVGNTNPDGPEIEINGSRCLGCDGITVQPLSGNQTFVQIRDLVINGFAGSGVVVGASDSPQSFTGPVRVDGCYIGTDPTGMHAVPNGRKGIEGRDRTALLVGTSFDNRFTTRYPKPNVIGGNGGAGVSMFAGRMDANLIGTDRTSLDAVANGTGVAMFGNVTATSNTIAFNRGSGVTIKRIGRNGLLRNSIHSNGGPGIDAGVKSRVRILDATSDGKTTSVTVQLDVPPPPKIDAFLYPWLVEVFAGSFTDGSGYGEGKRIVISEFLFDKYNEPATFKVKENLAGKFVAATLTPWDYFPYIPFGDTSEFSKTVQVTTADCRNDSPSLTNDGANGHFTWTAVAGATSYRVWLMRPGTRPQLGAEVSMPEATLQLDAGTYEWWVEAVFPACYGTQSDHRVQP